MTLESLPQLRSLDAFHADLDDPEVPDRLAARGVAVRHSWRGERAARRATSARAAGQGNAGAVVPVNQASKNEPS
ncbi:hypothetical protein GCM10009541_33360 [Micromonospora gifhornensis]|uniref:Uncharacterized protein n=1 Tax=Micromonospora gifhornensis TaxID=84594 RepID=A0ABQ4IA92_9ACTN|nr:hypothetical protein [Micromonospora gifhornensis]GIJ14817.1 hypothetical protein Vgi01_15010 [Micromonospora gifhornensis]